MSVLSMGLELDTTVNTSDMDADITEFKSCWFQIDEKGFLSSLPQRVVEGCCQMGLRSKKKLIIGPQGMAQ